MFQRNNLWDAAFSFSSFFFFNMCTTHLLSFLLFFNWKRPIKPTELWGGNQTHWERPIKVTELWQKSSSKPHNIHVALFINLQIELTVVGAAVHKMCHSSPVKLPVMNITLQLFPLFNPCLKATAHNHGTLESINNKQHGPDQLKIFKTFQRSIRTLPSLSY